MPTPGLRVRSISPMLSVRRRRIACVSSARWTAQTLHMLICVRNKSSARMGIVAANRRREGTRSRANGRRPLVLWRDASTVPLHQMFDGYRKTSLVSMCFKGLGEFGLCHALSPFVSPTLFWAVPF
ncbi:unnamed protein product, partial [Amoebophrya sp. A25]|eukprot:GSA25T00017504001.1